MGVGGYIACPVSLLDWVRASEIVHHSGPYRVCVMLHLPDTDRIWQDDPPQSLKIVQHNQILRRLS